MNKKNIIIFIRGVEVLRNFMEAGAFEEIEKFYNTYYFLPENEEIKNYPLFENVLIQDHRVFKGKKIITHIFSSKNYFLRKILKNLFVFRSSQHSCTYAACFYNDDGSLRRKRHFIYKLISNKIIAKLFTEIAERLISLDKLLLKKIKNISPAIILIPVSSPDNKEIELLKAAQRLKIKTGVIPLSWDNVSSKLFLYIVPDFILERGPENAEFAKKIFDLKDGRVSVVGVPHYEMFFTYQREANLRERRQAYLAKLGIPTDKKVFLFGGSLRPFDETTFLEKLENAIEEGILNKAHIIYRPHPERDKRIKEKSFFEMSFRHITFDEELKLAYLNLKSNFMPDLNNYLDLYNAIEAIICPPTSIMIEAALFGKPVLGLVCDDGVHYGWTSAQMIVNREHFKVWKGFKWFVRCHEKDNFIEDCKRLLEIVNTIGISEKIKKDLDYIVFRDKRSYAQTILDEIKKRE